MDLKNLKEKAEKANKKLSRYRKSLAYIYGYIGLVFNGIPSLLNILFGINFGYVYSAFLGIIIIIMTIIIFIFTPILIGEIITYAIKKSNW